MRPAQAEQAGLRLEVDEARRFVETNLDGFGDLGERLPRLVPDRRGADDRRARMLARADGAGGRPSLRADAADNDVLVYDDPLRTLIGLKNLLKQQHVAGHGADVAQMHARASYLLDEAQRGRAVLEREIKQVQSYHDPHPGMVAPVR